MNYQGKTEHIFCKEGTLFFIYLLFLHTVSEWILAWFKMRCCFVFVCLFVCLFVFFQLIVCFQAFVSTFSCFFFIIFASVTRHRWFRNYFPSIWCCREFLQLKIWLIIVLGRLWSFLLECTKSNKFYHWFFLFTMKVNLLN